MTTNQLQDKCRGSLVGGAVGDALGYPIEFKTLRTILRKYGFAGISMYELDCDGIARFSDDTQMTLFTAVGLLNAHVSINKCGIQIADSIKDSYLNWYMTQTDIPTPNKGNWLSHIEPLWAKRAPGSTCLHSLGGLRFHSPNNNSKGCGGVMRVAPIGIFGAMHSDIMPNNIIALYAGESAKITHCHPMSTYSSMALAIIVAECIRTEFIDRTVLKDIITNRAIKVIRNEFNDNTTLELENLLDKAIFLAESDVPDFDAIKELGEGWVAEETLAIAAFSTLRYIADIERCICCAVNHDGDSDSTGAVTGNIIGAIHGYEAIPEKFNNNLEMRELIISIADDLGGFSSSIQINERYRRYNPYNVDPNILIKPRYLYSVR